MSIEILSEFKGLQIRKVQPSAVKDYSALLSKSFQNFNPSISYLNWLYFENPRGRVCGFDAYDGETLVAHYACIPIKIEGFRLNSLLSLNTATHPQYQGRGLFGVLAKNTYESSSANFANVIGVANAKSVGGFIRHLGFSKVGNLDLRLGDLGRPVQGSRIYSIEDLTWRGRCPGRPLSISLLDSGSYSVSIKPFKFGPKLKAIVHESASNFDYSGIHRIGITLDWRKDCKPKIALPKRLKPSPLVLIFKPLLEGNSSVLTSFSFPDFDAF